MNNIEKYIRERLLALKDEKNQVFVVKLIPNIPSETILWIKTPVLRNLANELTKEQKNFEFLNILPQ